MALTHPPPSALRLTAAGEPFRLLFPLGTMLGILGVALWPAFAWGLWPVYPAAAHAPIMIHGFLASYVFGFLGTALPRLLDAPKLGLRTTLLLGAGPLALSIAHLAEAAALGFGLFLVWLTGFLLLLGSRFRENRDIPPPGFVLVALGLLCGWTGSLLLFMDAVGTGLGPTLYTLARLLAWQAFLLFPVLGIGAFLLPRFFGMPSKHAFPEQLLPSPAWLRRAGFASACGSLILIGFSLEAYGHAVAGHLLRALGLSIYLLREIPLHKAHEARGDLALGLRIALIALPLGLVLASSFAGAHLGWMHVFYLTGFGLITFIVATRVLLGHSGQSGRFTARLPGVRVLSLCTVLSLALRVRADYLNTGRFEAYAWAALIWIGGVAAWTATTLPRIRYPDNE
ncbi:MAG: NnrS family protein [Opitutales bacterium]|nr:NnrS family protein [Opitutales bacterium]